MYVWVWSCYIHTSLGEGWREGGREGGKDKHVSCDLGLEE